MVTIDFNRCIAQRSDGFKQSYNIPDTSGIDFADSTPDFTRREVREWFGKSFGENRLTQVLVIPEMPLD